MTHPYRVPADVDREDRLIGPLTGRQLLILTVAGFLLYAAYAASRPWLPLPVFGVAAVPVAAITLLITLGSRDGMSLDRLLLAAIRHRRSPRSWVNAPEGIPDPPDWLASRAVGPDGGPPPSAPRSAGAGLPARRVSPTGVIDLGPDGLAAVAVTSTVHVALRTEREQEALVAVFARYLHSLTGPVQILIRAERLDLAGEIRSLRERAAALPHPALEQAALEHAGFLAQLAAGSDLLRRQVLLVLREPLTPAGAPDGLGGASPWQMITSRRAARAAASTVAEPTRRAAQTRLARRVSEAVDLLAPAGIVVTPLSAGQVSGILAAACNPGAPLPAASGLAGPDEIITTGDGLTFDPPAWEAPGPLAGDPSGAGPASWPADAASAGPPAGAGTGAAPWWGGGEHTALPTGGQP